MPTFPSSPHPIPTPNPPPATNLPFLNAEANKDTMSDADLFAKLAEMYNAEATTSAPEAIAEGGAAPEAAAAPEASPEASPEDAPADAPAAAAPAADAPALPTPLGSCCTSGPVCCMFSAGASLAPAPALSAGAPLAAAPAEASALPPPDAVRTS